MPATATSSGRSSACIDDPESFTVRLASSGGGFTARVTTGTDGRLTIPSLPPGRYTLSAGLAQSFGGGASRTLERDVTIIDGETTELELAFSAGTTVAVAAQPPTGTQPDGLSFWLFSGSMPADLPGTYGDFFARQFNLLSLGNLDTASRACAVSVQPDDGALAWIPPLLASHLELTLISLVAAATISVPLTIAVSRRERLAFAGCRTWLPAGALSMNASLASTRARSSSPSARAGRGRGAGGALGFCARE